MSFFPIRGRVKIAVTAALFVSALGGRAWASPVLLVSPTNGSTVSGTVIVSLSPAPSTAMCNLYVDGVYQNSTPPNFFYWQTSSVANGPHQLVVTGYDSLGDNLGSVSSTVTVANGIAVWLTSPTNGSTVSGIVPITLTTGPTTASASVYINGTLQASTPPDTFQWDTTGVSNGQYSISASAFDQDGNAIGSAQLTVTVANAAPTPVPTPTPAGGNGGGNGNGEVSISSPANGATVSGNVNVTSSAASDVVWVNYYIDGTYLSSSPPYNFSWNSATVLNGNHVISASAFANQGVVLGTASTTVNVRNSPMVGSTYFYTLPPGSTLPSEAVCASEVKYSDFEPAPNNYTANHTIPSDTANLATMRSFNAKLGISAKISNNIDGNFTGTTDEILQWGACKWGIDENLVRAMAANESWGWNQAAAGDFTSNLSLCFPGLEFGNGGCYLSYGVMQVKATDSPGTFPDTLTSTAYVVDYKLGYERACMEGQINYLRSRSPDYPSGDPNDMLWGCVDQWYTGTWWNGTDDAYITETKYLDTNKAWLWKYFIPN